MSVHHILLDPDARPVIAHRGASGLAPENTLEALELGLGQGADALEFDVRLAGCGTPVLMHDPTIDRTTGVTGPVGSRSAAGLAACDAGFRFSEDGNTFPWRGRGVRVPTLAEVLERFPETPVLIELKTVEAALPVRDLLRRFGARDRVVLASFLDQALAPFRDGGFATSASRRGIFRHWLGSRLGFGATGPDPAYAVPERYRGRIAVPTPAFIRAARKAGRPVHVWTVNEVERARELWDRGVSGIITNYPGLIRQASRS
ncbi:MAG: glycerophosphodiester phosphodiesterase [Gemmatimonadales bacterium]